MSRWPHIPIEEREVAEILAACGAKMRPESPLRSCMRSVWVMTCRRRLSRAIEAPQSSGLPLSVVSELVRNTRYRATTQRNAVILGSHLHPLSLLLYGAELENITCLGHDHWLVSTVGRKLSSSVEPVLER